MLHEPIDTSYTIEISGRICKVQLGQYMNGATALMLVEQNGEPAAVASVNLQAYGVPIPPYNEVWLKGWSENKGIPKALEAAGVLKRSGLTTPAGYCTAEHAVLCKDIFLLTLKDQEVGIEAGQ